MAKHEQVIKHCGGGTVQFGIQGQGVSVYLTRFQMCVSTFQDALYGAGRRLFNACVKDRDVKGYRCTVCGAGHGIVRP